MGNTRNTGYLQNIVLYDENDNITLPARLAVTGTVAVNNTTPYDTTQFSLDVNGGLIVKNINKTAQFVLINSNPASGGNNAFVVHTVGGTSASSYADIQGYYGTSVAGSTVLRLNPQGGNVLVGSLAGTGSRMVVASATGVLSTQAIVTLGDLSGVPTSRTITINGTTQDLSANRTFTIDSMVYPGAGIAVSTGTAWGTSLTDNSSNWNTAYGWGNHASAGYATTTYVGTQIANLVASSPATLDTLNELAAALGNDPSFATTVSTSIGTKVPQTRTITINGTGYDLSANRSWTINSMVYPSAGIALSTGTAWGTSITDNSANWNTAYGWGNHASGGYLTSATAATTYASLTGSYANPSWITSLAYSKITGVPAFLTSYTETDTLATVTGRGASTSTAVVFNGAVTTNAATIIAGAFRFYSGGSDGSTTYGDFRTNPASGNSIISAKTNALYFNYDHGTGGVIFCDGATGIVATVSAAGVAVFNGNVTGASFIKSGGTSAQFLKADGSIDSSIYLTGITSSQVTTALGFTPYNSTNPSGYLTGITSSQVTTALGYTPYNSTNPSGYITGITSANVTGALGYTPYNSTNPNGYITGISFANVSSKPTTLSGYGILDSLYQAAQSGVNVNAFNGTGLYRGSTGDWSNRPTVIHNGGALLQIDTHPGNYHQQLFFDTGGNRLYMRSADAGTWGSWVTMWHTGNLTNLNQLSNGPGYITSYTETDTLSSVVGRGASTSTGITINPNGTSITMGGGSSAEGIRMQASTSTTYPVFLRSVNPAGGGETSPWLYKEESTPWGIWHNNPINTFDFTSAGSGGIAQNVGGGTNQVMVRIDPAAGYVQTASGFKNSAGTVTLDNSGNISGNAATATNVAWTGVTGRPTALSSFTNDLGNYGSWITASSSNTLTNKSGNISQWTNDSGYVTSSNFSVLTGVTNYNVDRTTKISNGLAIYSAYSGGSYSPNTYDISAQYVIGGKGMEFAASWHAPSTVMYFRTLRDCCDNWSPWTIMLSALNYSNYAPTLTGGGASGSWGISITGNAATVTNGVYTTGDQTIGGVKTFGKRTYFGSSSGWDSGSLNGENDTITNLHFQGHADFWIGAGNGTWYTTAAAGEHDLIINTMQAQTSYDRGISFTSSFSGTSGYRLGKWYSKTSAATSYLSISGGLTVGGKTTFGSISGAAQTVPNTYGAYLHLGDWAVGRTATGAVLVNTAYRADYATDLFDMNISRFTNNSGYITSSGILITIQDTAPAGVAGKLWWESDTGKLKVYYGSAWVDASPIPDVSLYYSKAGGTITGDVSIGQTLNVVGNTLVQGTISAFGDVIAYSSSDIRLKDNVTVIESPLEKLSKINGVSFNWNDKQTAYEVGKKDIGVIAQEIEEVLPELVTTRDNGYKAVRYEKIVALLIEAVKEQQAQINNLTDKLNNL